MAFSGGTSPMRGIAPAHHQEPAMMDALMLAIALGLFAASVGYVVACDRL
jgi:hypothetical protein